MQKVSLFLLVLVIQGALLTGCRTSRLKQDLTNGYKRVDMVYNGYERYYLTHIPKSGFGPDHKYPLLFALHGGGGEPENMSWLTNERFNLLADRYGFIVVYPQGFDKGWNDGRVGDHSTAAKEKIDDVGFIGQIINDLSLEHKIDRSRVYTCGISNGGFMSSRLAWDIPSTIKGAAIVTATLGKEYSESRTGNTPVDILIINGTSDPLVPYNGGYVKALRQTRGLVAGTEEYAKIWARINGCDSKPVIDTLPNNENPDKTRCVAIEWQGGAMGTTVKLIKVEGGGHTWPQGRQYLGERLIGKTSGDFNACDEIVRFFKLTQQNE